MHSLQFEDKVHSRSLHITIPECDRAVVLFGLLTERMGEKDADAWFDATITEQDTWTDIITKIRAKMLDLADVAMGRIDRSEQAHPGTI